ncbi:MAG: hypothetical protein GY810_04980 [Aureispira sp.]|nr:hypothetical protein [Aureispira sp.]
MKILFSVVLILFGALFIKAQTPIKIKYSKISKDGKKVLKKIAPLFCECLEKHGDELQTSTAGLKTAIGKMGDNIKSIDDVMEVMADNSTRPIQFGQCTDAFATRPLQDALNTEAARFKKKKKKVVTKEYSPDDSPAVVEEEPQEVETNPYEAFIPMYLINAGLKKYCKKHQAIFEDFLNTRIALTEKMGALEKALREED